MKRNWSAVSKVVLAFGLLLLGCASSASDKPSKTAQQRASAAESKSSLGELLAQHDFLVERITSKPEDIRTRCELTAGDCLVLVAERRVDLTDRHSLHPCRDDNATGDTCLLDQLSSAHKESDAAEYVTFKSWCFEQLLACIETGATKSGEERQSARTEARRRKIETSPLVVELWRAADAARARVSYVRATLPPQAEKACALPRVENCRRGIDERLAGLEAELSVDDYDEGRVARAYAALKREEASCVKPELNCLTSALKSFGLDDASRPLFERNLVMLQRRQRIGFTADASTQAECLSGEEATHAPFIEEAFEAYALSPVATSRARLEQAYLDLHLAQLACFARVSNGSIAEDQSGVIDLD